VAVSNPKKVPLWVRVEIDQLEGDDDCMATFKLEPRMSHLYTCPQTFVAAGKRFRAEAIVYRDSGNTEIAETIRRLIELKRGPKGQLLLIGRPAN